MQIERIKKLLLQPKLEWPAIAAEPATVAGIYRQHLLVLAAIPALAGAIGIAAVGVLGLRVPFGFALLSAVVQFGVTLALIYVLAMIVNALAPNFGSQSNSLQAFKLIAYGMTAALLAGIFQIIPALGFLALAGAVYSIYLIYLGLPATMGTPPDKAAGFTAVIVICGIVAAVVLNLVAGAVTAPLLLASGGASLRVSTPQGDVKIDTAKIEEAARKAEGAARQMAESAKAAASGKAAAAIAPAAIRALLPDSLSEFKRESIDSSEAAGFSSVAAGYRSGERAFKVEVNQAGGFGALANVAQWAGVTSDRETADEIERIYKDGARTRRERLDKRSGRAETTVVFANGIILEAHADSGLELADLKRMLDALDLSKFESLQAAN